MSMATPKYSKKRKSNRIHGDLSNSLIEIAVEHIKQSKSTEFALRDLANKLGVSHAAAYRHFTNKQALIEAIALRGFQTMNLHFQHKLEKTKTPLVSLGEAYIQFAVANPGYYRVMFSANYDQSTNEDLKSACKKSFEALTLIFGKKDKSSASKSIFSWAVVHGLSMLLIDGQIKTPLEDFGVDQAILERQILLMTTKAVGLGSKE